MPTEQLRPPEQDPRTRHIVVTTGTQYPKWYEGPLKDPHQDIDKVRGDLALKTLGAARTLGYRTIVIDGGSSPDFISAMAGVMHEDESDGCMIRAQQEAGMSAGRVEGFEQATQMSEAKVIAWMEPEKVALIPELLKAALPILEKHADIVIPARNKKAFESYPPAQAAFEKNANRNFNELVRRRSKYYPGHVEFDAWFGPRLFRNDPELVALFSRSHDFRGTGKAEKSRFTDHIKPERWANALFLPIISALHERYSVVSMPVSYSHPTEQTQFETDNEEMDAKRREQFADILTSSALLLRELRGRGDGKAMSIVPANLERK